MRECVEEKREREREICVRVVCDPFYSVALIYDCRFVISFDPKSLGASSQVCLLPETKGKRYPRL